jgi:hypothetical protein
MNSSLRKYFPFLRDSSEAAIAMDGVDRRRIFRRLLLEVDSKINLADFACKPQLVLPWVPTHFPNLVE